MSSRGSRKNTETDSVSPIELVQLDGLVVMNLIKHCNEPGLDTLGIAQGTLLGLVADNKLEITHSFPFQSQEELLSDEEFQLEMMKKLRAVNVDHLCVGWYQSAHFGNFLSTQLLESHFAYQTSIEESICLIFDTAKTRKGLLSFKAFRLTPMALKLYKEGDMNAEKVADLKVSHDKLFEEVPISIRNSHLVNQLLLDLSEEVSVNPIQTLDLGCANVLEEQLKLLTENVDNLHQESQKFLRYQHMAIKQCQDRTRYSLKRIEENKARLNRGADPLPNEDLNKLFPTIPQPSRLSSLMLSGQSLSTTENISEFSCQALAKWYVTEALQKTKVENITKF